MIGVLLNAVIPEWAITGPLFILLLLMTVQTTTKVDPLGQSALAAFATRLVKSAVLQNRSVNV